MLVGPTVSFSEWVQCVDLTEIVGAAGSELLGRPASQPVFFLEFGEQIVRAALDEPPRCELGSSADVDSAELACPWVYVAEQPSVK
ncbi:MAG TPA: hypothetical protein VHW44_08185 [Pseudonocardiaceae bacterium]|jgi:hypothetical protein|nr:hypothetical protein [Pseudonocardiaceae bacterium]